MSPADGDLAAWLKGRLADPLGLTQAIVSLSENWSSEANEHRLAIRTAVAEALRSSNSKTSTQNEKDLDGLSDLSKIPRLLGHALSISHCPDLGGFVLVKNFEGTIGFDAEISSRITVPVATRVLPHASEAFLRERLQDDDTATPATSVATSIWTAKESAIKCFGNAFADRTLNYTNVELISLSCDPRLGFTFTARFENHSARGILASNLHRSFALAVRNSS